MAGFLSILWAINGYLTIAGLVTESVGMVVEGIDPATAEPIKQAGAVMTGVGATRKGVKKYQGKPVF
jgi:hypothetical protein